MGRCTTHGLMKWKTHTTCFRVDNDLPRKRERRLSTGQVKGPFSESPIRNRMQSDKKEQGKKRRRNTFGKR